jgi:hypothetical protein
MFLFLAENIPGNLLVFRDGIIFSLVVFASKKQ